MALTLHVDTPKWRQMVDTVWAQFPDLIPVVKGNGYGFGRPWLAHEAHQRGATTVAIGTVYELAHVLALPVTPLVLTPSWDLDSARVPGHVVLTVGSLAQAEHVVRFRPSGPVAVKASSGMQRHGMAAHHLPQVLKLLADAGTPVHSVAIHPGLVGTQEERRLEVEALLPAVPRTVAVSVSHLDAEQYALLRARDPQHPYFIRLGSALWHGAKEALVLRATVLDTTPVLAGARVGYRGVPVPGDGTVVLIDAGSSHGVSELPDGRSPYHYAKRRMTLLESPHMHVSMVFVRNGDPCPNAGEAVDVQRPLITTMVDRIVWA